MRVLSLCFLVGCGSKNRDESPAQTFADTGDAYTPGLSWGEASVSSPVVLAQDLDDPQGLVLVDGVWFVAERGAGRVLALGPSEPEVFADGFDAPSHLAATDDGFVVTDADAIWVVSPVGFAQQVVAFSGGLADMAASGTDIWWVLGDGEAGDLWHVSLTAPDSARVVLPGLDQPGGVAADDGIAWVVETGSKRVHRMNSDGVDATESWTTELPGVEIAVNGDSVVLTTMSERWPYPGFVERLSDGVSTVLGEVPPEPGLVQLTEDSVFFATKQGIARMPRDGGTFESLALRTSVGAFVVHDTQLVWTDPERGMVWMVDLRADRSPD
jgi:hypothetical protein